MARYGPRIVYKTNGLLLGKQQLGRKVMDAQTGFWCYESYLVPDAYDTLVDARGDGYDITEGVPNASIGGRNTPYLT